MTEELPAGEPRWKEARAELEELSWAQQINKDLVDMYLLHRFADPDDTLDLPEWLTKLGDPVSLAAAKEVEAYVAFCDKLHPIPIDDITQDQRDERRRLAAAALAATTEWFKGRARPGKPKEDHARTDIPAAAGVDDSGRNEGTKTSG